VGLQIGTSIRIRTEGTGGKIAARQVEIMEKEALCRKERNYICDEPRSRMAKRLMEPSKHKGHHRELVSKGNEVINRHLTWSLGEV